MGNRWCLGGVEGWKLDIGYRSRSGERRELVLSGLWMVMVKVFGGGVRL